MRSNENITSMYERHVDTVYRLCFSYLKTVSDTEDAVQNVFIKVINYPGEFTGTEHEKAWLITCAANYCKDILKSAYKKRTSFDIPEHLPDSNTSSSKQDNDEIYEAVLALPDKYKDCIYLHYFEGYKTKEIAELLGKPASTIRSYLSEARGFLRQHLGGEAYE